MIKTLIEKETVPNLCEEKVLGGIDQNGNYTTTVVKKVKNGVIPAKIVVQKEYTEDRTSSDYIPKSYRSQTFASRFLTKCLEICGITFSQPIKWKNVTSIITLHIVALYVTMAFPVFEVKFLTVIWGEFCYIFHVRILELVFNINYETYR